MLILEILVMPSFLILFLDFGCAAIVLYALRRLLLRKPFHLPFPPGPAGRPIVANLFDWPTHTPWEIFIEWGHKYGDIMHANVMGQHMIVLNSYEAAAELLHRRGAQYSGRAPFHFALEMAGYKIFTTLIVNAGELWKEQRALFAHHIGTQKVLARFLPAIDAHTRHFLCNIIEDPKPESLNGYIRLLAGAIMLDVTYGYEAKSAQDDLICLAEEVLSDVSKAVQPGAHLVDIFPSLSYLPSWFPGTTFKKEAALMKARLIDLINIPYKFTQDNMAADAVQHSFVASQCQKKVLSPTEVSSLQLTAATMYATGADTTVSYIYAFFWAMTAHPELQAKAQAEIDNVVGSGRLPTLADRAQLPFVEAVVLEVYRYGEVLPLGVAHRVIDDDMYHGYYIPKNSLVIPNMWAMSRDPRTYQNPEIFDPYRFLRNQPERDPRSHIFGFGRRICAGRVMADNNIFLTCAMALATLDISKAVSPDGNTITPVLEIEGGFLTHPRTFPCVIKARSSELEELLKTGPTT